MYDIRPIAGERFGYVAYDGNKEIGLLIARPSIEGKYLQMHYFRVRELYRHKGIGRSLFYKFLEDAICHGFSTVTVFPYSDPYGNEKTIEQSLLYQIYQGLGFHFVLNDIDVNTANHKMELDVAEYGVVSI